MFNIEFTDLPIEWGKQSFFPADFESAGCTGALVEKSDRVVDGNNMVVYFNSEDCVTEEAKVENAGGKILRPKMSIGDFGFVSILMDTEGNTIGLHSRK